MYIIRLDDASEHMNLDNWIRIKALLDKYGVKPIYGIIPNNQDLKLLKYDVVHGFWDIMRLWQTEGWTPALHGYNHVFETKEGGINPVQRRSEFAGVSLEQQRKKIKKGYQILIKEGIRPLIFFAPAHTFDVNTLKALYKESPIRILSDTIANDIYYNKPFYFIPQQSGRVRRLPFKTTTFCYHPNIMNDNDFIVLEKFLKNNNTRFKSFDELSFSKRKINVLDLIISKAYFYRRKRMVGNIK